MALGAENFCCVGLDLNGVSCIGAWGVGPLHVLPYMLLLSRKHILHYFDRMRKQFFVLLLTK